MDKEAIRRKLLDAEIEEHKKYYYDNPGEAYADVLMWHNLCRELVGLPVIEEKEDGEEYQDDVYNAQRLLNQEYYYG